MTGPLQLWGLALPWNKNLPVSGDPQVLDSPGANWTNQSQNKANFIQVKKRKEGRAQAHWELKQKLHVPVT